MVIVGITLQFTQEAITLVHASDFRQPLGA
jgi:hypothetical protein